MERMIIIIVSLVFLRPVFELFLPRSPAMKKFVFFCLAIFLPPEKKNPRGDAAGEGPATKQAKGKSHANAWLLLSECDKRDTLFFYSFGFRILDTSVTCRFSFFIQPFDFLLLLWNFNFLKFMCHWFLPQKPICNVMYILYIYNRPSYIVLYSFLLEL